MITIDTYFDKIARIDFSALPDAQKKGHELVVKATNNGASWASYHSSETIQKTIDIYLAKLNEFTSNSNKAERKQSKKVKERNEHDEIIQNAMRRQGITTNEKKPRKVKTTVDERQPMMEERIPEELKFIRQFVNLNGKTKTKDEILRFINSLQKAIVEKRIRKTSAYAEQIRFIQEQLIDVYSTMSTKIKIELKPETHDELKKNHRGRKGNGFYQFY